MKKESVLKRIFRFYAEGFRNMTIGKTLWIIILLKLFIMFCILKPFFFKSHLSKFKTQEEKKEYVIEELVNRSTNP